MIHLHLDGVPPSSNNAYANMRGGGRILTKEGKRYLAETKSALAQNFPRELRFFKKNTPYLVAVRFSFLQIENAGWATEQAKNRYKHFDAGNRLKLVEDCLKDIGGIDDSQNMRLVLEKQQGKETTQMWIWDMNEEESPFDVGFNALRPVQP